MVVSADRGQVVAVLGDDRDAASVDAIALAPVPALEHASPGRQSRRNVKDGLADGDELLGQQPPEAAGALDGPDALRPVSCPCSQLDQRRLVGQDTQLACVSSVSSSATAVWQLL